MDYQEIINERNRKSNFAKALGIEIKEIEKGYARCEMQLSNLHGNAIDTVHGGALFSLADVACGSAAASGGYKMTTISSNFNFISVSDNKDTLVAVAKEVKSGRKICVYDVDIADSKGKLIAKGTFSFYNLGEPLGL